MILKYSPISTKIAIKWTKINLQTSVIPIWKAENQGYKIGYEKSLLGQLQGSKNGPKKFVRIYSATTVWSACSIYGQQTQFMVSILNLWSACSIYGQHAQFMFMVNMLNSWSACSIYGQHAQFMFMFNMLNSLAHTFLHNLLN